MRLRFNRLRLDRLRRNRLSLYRLRLNCLGNAQRGLGPGWRLLGHLRRRLRGRLLSHWLFRRLWLGLRLWRSIDQFWSELLRLWGRWRRLICRGRRHHDWNILDRLWSQLYDARLQLRINSAQ